MPNKVSWMKPSDEYLVFYQKKLQAEEGILLTKDFNPQYHCGGVFYGIKSKTFYTSGSNEALE